MKKISLIYLIYFVATSFSFGQTEYYTGASTVSIEPGNSVFSTALAGYGLPREGRFSLSWEYLAALPAIKAVTGHEGQLYAIAGNKEFFVLEFSDTVSGIKTISSSEDITALAALNGKLYGINDKGQVLLAQEIGKEISWKSIGKAPEIQSFTGFNGSFYGVNDSGNMVIGTLSDKQLSWKKPGVEIPEGRIISLTSDKNRLYALNENDSLWAGELQNNKFSWIQIGRNNSLTYAIKARHIAVNKDRLFAVSDENKLYVNRHSTEGDLSARALAVQNGDKTAIIVSLDLCGFEKSLTDEIRETVFQKYGIHKAAVLINATHTHFAPITQKWYALGEFYETPNSDYLQKVKRSVVQAIGEAIENMRPSKINFSRGSTAIGRNRRISSNEDAPYDNVLDVIRITNLQENTRQVLFLTGCHPVYENSGKASFTLSANYPGVARRVIEKFTETDNAIFMQGLGGDINPKTLDHKETGEELAENTLALLSEEMKEISGEISFFQDTVQIPIQPWDYNRIKQFRKENLQKKGNLEAERNLRWAELMLDRYEKGTMPTSLPVYVQTINIGNWKLIGLSREVVNEYGPAIRALWPDQLVSVAGYCNDITSYLPADWHINRGVYEGKGSFFWYGVPGTFPLGVKDQIINHIRTSKK